jgi:hypothetical protein
MKTIAFLLIFSAAPAFAQELPTDGGIFDVLKLGDWVSYRSVTTGDMLDVTIVNKPAGTTIKAYRDKLTKERSDSNASLNKYNEAIQELQTANISREERSAKLAALRQERDQVRPFAAAVRGSIATPYELTAIRKEYVVLNNGTQERFIAKSAVRMIIRNLPTESAEANK